ncbi:MAG TPA: pilin [Patescibacteria group bacterium]|nr:pilin [Patescibacteria group bacterium]
MRNPKSKIKNPKSGRFFPHFLFSVFYFLPIARAADVPNWKDIDFPGSRFTDIAGLVQAIINWLLGLGGALAVIAIVYSGIMYITAGDDPTKAETAKKNLVWAVIGVVIILLAYVIINEVARILGG